MVKPKTESTAVNELINLVATRGPSVSADDLLFREPDPKPMARKRAPLGTQPNPTSAPMPDLMATTMLGSGPQHLNAPPAPPASTPTSTLRGSAAAIPVGRPSLPPLPRPSLSMAAVTPPPVPSSRASIALPPTPSTTDVASPPPLPRASMSMAAVTPPPVPTSRASIALSPVAPPARRTSMSISDVTPAALPPSRLSVQTTAVAPPRAELADAPRAGAAAITMAARPSVLQAPPLAAPTPALATMAAQLPPHLPTPRAMPVPDRTTSRGATPELAGRDPLISTQREAPVAKAKPDSNPLAGLYADQARADLTDQSWFMDTRAAERIQPPTSENWIGTTAVPRRGTTRGLVGKLVLPAILAAVVGVFVGGYLVLDGNDAKKPDASADTLAPVKLVHTATGPASAAEPAPSAVATTAKPVEPIAASATEPVAAPAAVPVTPPNVATAPATPSLVPPNLVKAEPAPAAPAMAAVDPGTINVGAKTYVDIRIDSKPSGATVTLVDRGKSTFLGTTPIVTSVDPSRTYDVMFEHHDRTQLEHLDPRATSHLQIALGSDKREETRAAKIEKPAKAEKKAEAPKAVKVEAPKAAKVAKVEAPKSVKAEAPRIAKTEKAVASPAVAAPVGEGLLMISSKPPCELYIDGKATGLMTPQRGIPLAAGKHKIMLVSPDKQIKKTVAVDIVADKPTKVIQDLMGE